MRTYISALLFAAALCSCATKEQAVEFGPDSNRFEIGAEGGTRSVAVASDDSWTATTSDPWISISPANGRGSAACHITIDSALVASPRKGVIRIQNQNSLTSREITIEQKGYDYSIALEKLDVEVENFAAFGQRHFDLKVTTNVDFDIKVPASAESWLKFNKPTPTFDRGLRPRVVTVRFEWGINSRPDPRLAEVLFTPKKEVELVRQDKLNVTQRAAEKIEENTRKGDSVALLAVARSLGVWSPWDGSERMDNWADVTLWKEGPLKGRVRYARFFIFGTKEGLPFEVQYLTAAEELVFSGNSNTFLLSLDPGDYISMLGKYGNLKRLTISAYGLTTLPASFTELKSLESLDLGGNNFQKVPELLNPTNFPHLHRLMLRGNQRSTIYDLSNTVLTNYGGLVDEENGFPRRLLEWEKLDTLALSVNFMQNSVPDMEDYPIKYTQADINAADTLPQALIGFPKVLPKARMLAINLNRLTGDLPRWLLYHPALNWMGAEILIFTQEGKDKNGKLAGFNNVPVNMDYYYKFYPNKKPPYQGEE